MAETVEELIEKYRRDELDEIADELGLDPTDYATKHDIAEAIVKARGEEKKPPKMEVVKMEKPHEIGKKGVIAKMDAIEKFTLQMGKNVKKMQDDISKQVKENEDSVKKHLSNVKAQENENRDAVKKIEVGVKEIQTDIKNKADTIKEGAKKLQNEVSKQVKENEEAVKKINAGVKEIQIGIKNQISENESYINDFYYG